MKDRALGGWAAAVLLLVACAVFAPALLGDRVFYQRDILGYFYPHLEVVKRLLAEGSWPSWNPYDAFGAPFFADPNFQLAYPPTWLGLALPSATYFKLYAVAHCWAAGFGAFNLARRIGGSPVASLVAGVVYCCGGPLLSALSLFHHFAGAAWMPWVLLALLWALDKGTAAAAAVLGAVAAGQALAGSADLCWMTALASLVLAGDKVLRGRGGVAAGLRRLTRVALVAVPFAAALAAVQWLPTLDLLSAGWRGHLNPETNLYWSLHPASLVDLAVPRLVSDLPLTTAARAALFEAREPLLACLYLGVAAGVLALLGLVTPGPGSRFALGLGLAAFLVAALGRHTPVYPLLLRLPVFGLFRYPTKYLLPASLFFALLACRGADAWLEEPRLRGGRRAVAVASVSLLAGMLALAAASGLGSPAGWLDRLIEHQAAAAAALRTASLRLQVSGAMFFLSAALLLARARSRRTWPSLAALAAILLGDAVLVGRSANLLAPAALLEHRPGVLGLMKDDYRVFSFPYALSFVSERFVGSAGWDSRAAWALAGVDRLQPPIGSGFGVRGSYDGDFTGLGVRSLYPMSAILVQYEATALGPRLLRMGNVGHVVSLHPHAFGLPEIASFPSVLSTPVRLFRVPDPLPPAYVVDGVQIVGEPRSWELMALGAFDPLREVVLAEGAEAHPATTGFEGHARVVSRRADLVVVEADLSGPGVLVLVEAWHQGWSVRVDGAPTPLLRANNLFRAVSLPAGKHTAVFEYRTPMFLAGATLAAGALATGAAVVLAERRQAEC